MLKQEITFIIKKRKNKTNILIKFTPWCLKYARLKLLFEYSYMFRKQLSEGSIVLFQFLLKFIHITVLLTFPIMVKLF